jgi:acetyltransferase-like isoleucine patch superfamily enzyme
MSNSKPALTPQQKYFSELKTFEAIKKYKELLAGPTASWRYFFALEIFQFLLGGIPGLIGLILRGLVYPSILGACRGLPAIGRSVTIKQSKKIKLGKGVLIDDFVTLEVRGARGSITLENNVAIGRLSTIVAKSGTIFLEQGVNIATYCRIATQSSISIGESTLIAAYCYIGPGNHQVGDGSIPLIEQPMEIKGGVSIGKNVWIGAHTTVLDGVTIGDGAIIGAHTLVKTDIPAGAVAVGIPARIISSSEALNNRYRSLPDEQTC